MGGSGGVPGGAREWVDTLVIGAGQAGLATSHWLTKAGLDHLVVERRGRLGGGWNDRWDGFCLVAPNFTVLLPGMPYAGPDPDGFMSRAEVVDHVTEYAAAIGAPVRLGTTVTRLAASDDHLVAYTGAGTIHARNVVLATGPYQRPNVPAASLHLPGRIQQLHSHEYRRPGRLAAGAVLVVGTGQSGTQIAEELHEAGRDVHLAVSRCFAAPRRYRGRDTIWWMLQILLHGADVGHPFPTVADLPTPAARFGCDPHLSGKDGGHDIDLRRFARRGMHLYGRLESLDEWGYPRHVRGVTTHPGLYAVGLPWLHSEPSSVFAGIGADAAHIVEHIAGRRIGRHAGRTRS
ncbi:flavin-containing monooxygenase [Actinomadura sp. HBU206391]|uniref:flavin-containing monooxygenase n=1 Tax=Actinomadura sp. HBU206391 TaxID=2731692 RepID=UPI0016503B5B|nr:NAD(P)/FAD-dependent oxidoreductase [Actinomadura sp. HBU206391]MBC6462015.1 NAD(P)-binding domain-containing protein [Actinomadura sp. HBU206391]